MGRLPGTGAARSPGQSRVTVSRGVPWQPHRRHQSSGDPARQHRSARLEALAGHVQAELIEPREGRQIRAREACTSSSVRHVEVLQMGSVKTSPRKTSTSIPGSPRRELHLIWEELGKLRIVYDAGEWSSLTTLTSDEHPGGLDCISGFGQE
jgi:hypothetical protein